MGTAELVIYAAGGSTSSIVAAVNTLKTDLGVGIHLPGAAALAVVVQTEALQGAAALAVVALAVAAPAGVALVWAALTVARGKWLRNHFSF